MHRMRPSRSRATPSSSTATSPKPPVTTWTAEAQPESASPTEDQSQQKLATRPKQSGGLNQGPPLRYPPPTFPNPGPTSRHSQGSPGQNGDLANASISRGQSGPNRGSSS